MLTREEIKKRLSSYSKGDLIDAILESTAATAFVLQKCKGKELKPADPKCIKEGK